MPLKVDIPVTLKIDASRLQVMDNDLDPLMADIDDALQSALGRVFANAHERVVKRRGAYHIPKFESPSFKWDGLEKVGEWPGELTQRVEKEVQGAIERAIEASGINTGGQGFEGAPTPIPDSPSEPFNPQRMKRGRYILPSYETHDPELYEPVILESTNEVSEDNRDNLDFWRFNGDNNMTTGMLSRALMTYYGRGPYPDLAGLMYREQHGSQIVISVARVRALGRYDGILSASFSAPTQVLVEDDSTPNPIKKRRVSIPVTGQYSLALERQFASKADLTQLVFSELKSEGWDYPDALLLEAASTLVDTATDGDGGGNLLRLSHPRSDNIRIVTGQTDVTQAMGSIPVFPVANVTHPQEEGEGGGGGGGDGGGGDHAGGAEGGTAGSGPRGGPLGNIEDGGGGPASVFPMINGEQVEIDFGPFLGEPSLDELGAFGDMLRDAMRPIARRLEMPMGEYCGGFLLAAAKMIELRGVAVGHSSSQRAKITPAFGQQGNLGAVDYEPTASGAISLIRYIGAVCPDITALHMLMSRVYALPEISGLFKGASKNNHNFWHLKFNPTLMDGMHQGVSHLFARTCQIMMLDLLNASRAAILERLENFERYAAMFEVLISDLIAPTVYLETLYDMILTKDSTRGERAVHFVSTNWREAREEVISYLQPSSSRGILEEGDNANAGFASGMESLEQVDGVWGITDKTGRRWTRAELAQTIQMRRQMIGMLDPMIHQLTDIPDLVTLYEQNPKRGKAYLRQLLEEMKASNEEVTNEVVASPIDAVRTAQILDTGPVGYTPVESIKLQGIHLMAHEAIYDAFERDHWYADAVNWLLVVEEGRAKILMLASMSVVIGLSIACPPLGMAVGAGMAVYDTYAAYEKEEFYQSFLTSQMLMTRAELEMELFFAEVGLALEVVFSVLPAVGKGIRRTGSSMLRSGVRAGTRHAMREAMEGLTSRIGDDLIEAFAREMVQDQMMDAVISKALEPAVELLLHDLSGPSAAPPGQPVPDSAASASGQTEPGDALSPEMAQLYERLDDAMQTNTQMIRQSSEDKEQ